ncbi:hypothetical protein SMICM17S_02611 [Streptomyces microflavus]
MPSLTIGSRHHDGPPGVGGAFTSGGGVPRPPVCGWAGAAAGAPPGAAGSSSAAVLRDCVHTEQPTTATDSSAANASIPRLPSIERKSPQPISASSSATSDAPSTRPDSSRRASFSSSPSRGSRSQAKP